MRSQTVNIFLAISYFEKVDRNMTKLSKFVSIANVNKILIHVKYRHNLRSLEGQKVAKIAH